MTAFIPAFVESEKRAAEETGRSFKVKRATVQQLPLAAERGYVSDLMGVVREIIKDVRSELVPQLKRLVEGAGLRRDGLHLDVEDVQAIIRTIVGRLRLRVDNEHLREMEQAVRRYRDEVSRTNRMQIARQLRRMIGVDVFPNENALRNQLDLWFAENTDRIKQLTGGLIDGVSTTVQRGLRQGDRAEKLEKDLEKEAGKTLNKARLIARDQITKLNSSLTQMRQTSLGIEEYIWRTSRDERVRPSHREKEGNKYRWDDPPDDTGHPGMDYLCRCTAEPVIEGFPAPKENKKEILREMKRKRAKLRERLKGKPSRRLIARESARETRSLQTRSARPKRPPFKSPFRPSGNPGRPEQPLKAAVFDAQQHWVTSSDSYDGALMKEAARQEFNLEGVAFGAKEFNFAPAEIEQARRVVRDMYNTTQRELKEKGIKSIELYRGIKKDYTNVGAIESWSDRQKKAAEFGDTVLKEEFPADKILNARGLSHWIDGQYGDEGEWIVMQ